jgi:hypothetical protein
MLTALLLAALAPDPNPALDRLAKFFQESPHLSADLAVHARNSPSAGQGRLVLSRPNRMLFTMRFGDSQFRYSATEEGVVEIADHDRIYKEGHPLPRLFVPESSLSYMSVFAFPAVFIPGDLRQLVTGMTFRHEGVEQVRGVDTDRVVGSYDDPEGTSTIETWIDVAGRPLRYKMNYLTAGGRVESTIDLSNYEVTGPKDLKEFHLDLPNGYVPDALPREPWPLEVGEAFPIDGWQRKGSAQELFREPTLVAVLDASCAASQRALGALKALGADHPLVVVATDRGGTTFPELSEGPTLYDPQGKALLRLRAAGTPFFFVVQKGGAVARRWYGFAPDREKAFLEAMRDALNGAATE